MQIFKTRAEYEAALQVGTVGEYQIEEEATTLVLTDDELADLQKSITDPGTYYLGAGDLSDEQRKAAAAFEFVPFAQLTEDQRKVLEAAIGPVEYAASAAAPDTQVNIKALEPGAPALQPFVADTEFGEKKPGFFSRLFR